MKFMSQSEKSSYVENGYILLKDVFDPKELEEISQEYDKLFQVKILNFKADADIYHL
jgi:hypothetical protein